MGRDWIPFLQAATGVVFLSAGAAKISFRVSVSPLLRELGVPGQAAVIAGWAIPVVEVALGVLLLTNRLANIVGAAASVIGLAFFFMQLLARRKHVGNDCRCFGPLDSSGIPLLAITRSLCLAVAALLLVVSLGLQGRTSQDTWSPSMTLSGAATGLALVLAFALLGEVWSLERRLPSRIRGSDLESEPAR